MKRTIFKILKNSQFAKFANFCMETQIFPTQVIPKVLFALHSHYTSDTPCRVWFDLDNSLSRWKRPIFKIPFSRSSKSSVWNTNFFPRQAMPKFFLLYTLFTLLILRTELGLIWITPWPDEKELFLKFANIRNSRNSQSSVWEPNFFPRQAIPKKFFDSVSHYAGDTPYRVWFDLHNSLTQWKIPLFEFPFSRNSKSPYEILIFFRTRCTNFFFLFYALISLVILHTVFGLIWTTPCPDEKELFF